MVPGLGTATNVVTVLLGSGIGLALGDRLPSRTREVVTDALGLVTLLIAGLSAIAVTSRALAAAVGDSAPVLIVLGSLLLGGIAGSLLGLEARLEAFGALLQRRLVGLGRRGAAVDGDGAAADDTDGDARRRRFVEGFVVSSLVFCTGPLTILGSLNDGLGNGADQLFLKSALDGFAAIAFAASFGLGVAASAVTVLVVQGGLTLVGLALGDVLPAAHLDAVTATGGLLLVGVALRLLRVREVPVADLLPALVVAPVLVAIVSAAH